MSTFAHTAMANDPEAIACHRFRVGSGAGILLLQRLTLLAWHMPQLFNRLIGISPCFGRRRSFVTTPRIQLMLAAAAAAGATIVIAGVTPNDYSPVKVAISVVGSNPTTATVATTNNSYGTTRYVSQGAIPRPNLLWSHPVWHAGVHPDTPTRQLTIMSTITQRVRSLTLRARTKC